MEPRSTAVGQQAMRVLVLGSSGLVGAAVADCLRAEAIEVVPFDIGAGQDVLDPSAVRAAAEGCHAIVNAAGGSMPGVEPGRGTLTLNVTGNWNVLQAARAVGARRVVTFSSVNALGVFRGEATPDYLPIDDDHPVRPPTTYGQAKRLVEELCRCFSETSDIATIVFRPPAVVGPERHAGMQALRSADPAAEWTPFWEYGAWIDTRDLARAVLAALMAPGIRHLTGLVCADDTSSPVPVRDLARRLLPGVPWRGPEPEDPARVLVRCDRVKKALGWAPIYRWSDRGM
ncbi:MAG: NAD(P)-dependent oxidoreductase [Alphaproteobacteria bacterium]|nr:NAD(P)-dependent oxidoreductase [Alphaproteobacteria bacterium]